MGTQTRCSPFASDSYEVVFSSNVFEHVARIDGLVAETARVVTPDGLAIIAVPPINGPRAMEEDMKNPFHVHHFPPRAWRAKLLRFFEDVQTLRHIGTGDYATEESHHAQQAKPPSEVTIRETDFEFLPIDAADIKPSECLTAVFLCRRPRAEPLPETIAERTPADWCESAVAAKLIGQSRDPAGNTAYLHARIAQLEKAWMESQAECIRLQEELSQVTERDT